MFYRLQKLSFILCAVLVLPACSKGFRAMTKSSSSVSDHNGGQGSVSAKFTCSNPATRGLSEVGLVRLTKLEHINSLSVVFGADVIAASSAISAIPENAIDKTVSEFNRAYSQEQTKALYEASLEIAKSVFANITYLRRVSSTCIQQAVGQTNVDRNCVRDWVTSLGLKLHRRPVTSAQLTAYVAILDDTALSAIPITARLELILAKMIQSAEAIYHWETAQGSPVGGRVRLDTYTVASRLAFRLTDAGPDADLLKSAADGSLANIDVLRNHARRLLASAQGRKKTRALITHWLHLEETPMPTAAALARFGLSSTDATRARLRNEMIEELLEFAEDVIFTRRGTFDDLMVSNLAFPRSAEAAKIFGTAIAGTQPVITQNHRGGLLTRPAILLSGVDRESPVFRGVLLRSRVLCENIPSPPADADGEIADAIASVDLSNFTMRENTRQITERGTCLGCHGFINPLGYSLSHFGPLGEFRTEERTYTTAGQVRHVFPINTVVQDARILGTNDTLNGHEELANMVARSTKGRSCFVRYAFQWTRKRVEQSNDHCALADAEMQINAGQPLFESIVQNVASEDIYWKKF